MRAQAAMATCTAHAGRRAAVKNASPRFKMRCGRRPERLRKTACRCQANITARPAKDLRQTAARPQGTRYAAGRRRDGALMTTRDDLQRHARFPLCVLGLLFLVCAITGWSPRAGHLSWLLEVLPGL